MSVVGFLRSTSFADAAHLVAAFRQGLKEAAFLDGQNIVIEYRSAEDKQLTHAPMHSTLPSSGPIIKIDSRTHWFLLVMTV